MYLLCLYQNIIIPIFTSFLLFWDRSLKLIKNNESPRFSFFFFFFFFLSSSITSISFSFFFQAYPIQFFYSLLSSIFSFFLLSLLLLEYDYLSSYIHVSVSCDVCPKRVIICKLSLSSITE